MRRLLAVTFAFCAIVSGSPNATAQRRPSQNEVYPSYKLRIEVVDRMTTSINYRNRDGATMIGFHATALRPGAKGEARVESKRGYTEVQAAFADMIPAERYGRQYLTYVLWAITPGKIDESR